MVRPTQCQLVLNINDVNLFSICKKFSCKTEELLLTSFRHNLITNAQKPPSAERYTPSHPTGCVVCRTRNNRFNIHYQQILTLMSLIFTRPCANDSRFLLILLVFAIRQRRSWGRRCVGTIIGHFEGEEWPICTVNGQTRMSRKSLIHVCLSYNFPQKITDG